MNLREGTRRLALLLGVAGAIFGGFVSYLQLQETQHQRADHKRFEQLADSSAVLQERQRLKPKTQYVRLPDGSWGEFAADASDASIRAAIENDFPGSNKSEKGTSTQNPIAPAPYTHLPSGEVRLDMSSYLPLPSVVMEDGIKTIHWTKNFRVDSLEMEDGQTLYPTPAPGAGSYLLIVILPVLGFFLPWGAVRAIGWVVAGFVQPLK